MNDFGFYSFVFEVVKWMKLYNILFFFLWFEVDLEVLILLFVKRREIFFFFFRFLYTCKIDKLVGKGPSCRKCELGKFKSSQFFKRFR